MKLTIKQIKEMTKPENAEGRNRAKQWLKHTRELKIKEMKMINNQITLINNKLKEI